MDPLSNYYPANPYASQILRDVRKCLDEEPEMQLERARLVDVCRAAETIEALQFSFRS